MDGALHGATEQLAEFRVLLDLTAERLWDLQRDFLAMQAEIVKYAMLATLATPVELQPCLEQSREDLLG